MKRISVFASILAIASIGFISCNKVEEEQINDEQGEFEYTFVLKDGVQSFDTTRAILGEDETGLYLKWENEDNLTVITNSSKTTGGGYSYSQGSTVNVPTDPTQPITFTIKSYKQLNANDMVYCAYPYNSNPGTNPASISMSISNTQEYKATGSLDGDYLPMVAAFPVSNAITSQNGTSSESDAVSFNAIASVIEFDIFSPEHMYAGEKIQSVTFTTLEDNDYIAGSFTFDLTGVSQTSSANLGIELSSNQENAITVSLPSNYAVTNSHVDKDNAAKVFMVVAPGTHAGTLKVVTDVTEYNYTVPSRFFSRASVRRFGINLEKEGARVAPYVILPWASAEEGKGVSKATLNAISGVSVVADSDYANEDRYIIKFSASSHYVVVETDSAIGAVSVDVKMNGSGSSLVFSESSNGTDWTDVQTIAIANNTLTTSNKFKSASRYVKIGFTKVSGSNAGIGRIAITKADTTPRIEADDVQLDAAGVTSAQLSFDALYFDNDVKVADENGFGGCVTAASVSNGKVVYTVAPNYGTTNTTGTITLVSAANSAITTTINVTQTGNTFSQSGATGTPLTITIPANSETATFTITSSVFGWNATATAADSDKYLTFRTGEENNYSYPGQITGNKKDEAQTITVRSTIEAPASGDPITLGTVEVYRNDNSSDPQKKTITIKKAVVTQFTPVTVWDDDFSSFTTANTSALSSLSGSKNGFGASYSSLGYCYPEVASVKLGNSSNPGYLETPAFSVLTSSSKVSVTVQYANYLSTGKTPTADGGTLDLTVTGGGSLSVSSLTPSSTNAASAGGSVTNWDSATFTITGATSSTKLKFTTSGGKKRFFINSITIVTVEN